MAMATTHQANAAQTANSENTPTTAKSPNA